MRLVTEFSFVRMYILFNNFNESFTSTRLVVWLQIGIIGSYLGMRSSGFEACNIDFCWVESIVIMI